MTANSRTMALLGLREIVKQFRSSVLPFTDEIEDESLRLVARETGEQIEHLLDRLLPPPTGTCPTCGRIVFKGNPPATGFNANCGRRLAFIQQCSAEDVCKSPAKSPAGESAIGREA